MRDGVRDGTLKTEPGDGRRVGEGAETVRVTDNGERPLIRLSDGRRAAVERGKRFHDHRWSRSMPGTTAGHTDAVGQQIPNLLGDQLDARRHQLPLRPHALAFCSNQDASLRGTGAIFAGTLLIIGAGL